MRNNIKKLIGLVAIVVVAVLSGLGITIAVNSDGTPEVIVDSTGESLPTLVYNEDGELAVENIELVENAEDGGIPEKLKALDEDGLPEDGAVRGYTVDISTPADFIKATYGQCIYLNNPWGSQCYNTSALLMENQVGYWPSTCGTGAAKGIWDCAEYNSRGNGLTWYYLVYNPWDLRPGDIAVTGNGVYGHTGVVAGYPFVHNGVWYVPLYSTNQGGRNCELGGQASNIINMSLATFRGALRWSGWDYLYEEPEPAPAPSDGVVEYTYKKGDTFGQVLINNGLSDGTDLWGAGGKVRYYNRQLLEQGILNYYAGQYWNNIPVGTTIKLEK